MGHGEEIDAGVSLLDLQSPRLTVRPWQDCSVVELAALFDPEVVCHLPPVFHAAQDDAERRSRLAGLSREAEVVALARRDLPRRPCVGLLILSHAAAAADTGENTCHLGYLFAKSAWGAGLASELISALQRHLAVGPTVKVCGGVEPDNHASARVLEKAGFQRDSDGAGGEIRYSWTSGRAQPDECGLRGFGG
ncbi:GNAT family N-acetyltransferase [Phaeobacter italicus]|uniref:GNAT family N-acetyltransferase n=1 Tax=Phaeobacter italicus TaxID=481446 RepID=UPI000186FABA|nr:GNAT family N-acetyltransferase [Phaeobacter italicus]EEB71956.1 GCN5-related N-acetyltransferase [Ruegeria sp. R11]CRL13264.1 hypothetical protein NIT7645_00275 [Phaeobacter italicus]SFH42187.1 Protein N-acetyltransferase, RimJ/RimL family [Phaeobacter italicus]